MSWGSYLARQEVDGRKHDVAGMYNLVAGPGDGDDPCHSNHNEKVDMLAHDLQQRNHHLTRRALAIAQQLCRCSDIMLFMVTLSTSRGGD